MNIMLYWLTVIGGLTAIIIMGFICWKHDRAHQWKRGTVVKPRPVFYTPQELEKMIPVGCKRAVICDWDIKQQPLRAAFRAKDGKGKIITATVIETYGFKVSLRHKIAEPIFERLLVV